MATLPVLCLALALTSAHAGEFSQASMFTQILSSTASSPVSSSTRWYTTTSTPVSTTGWYAATSTRVSTTGWYAATSNPVSSTTGWYAATSTRVITSTPMITSSPVSTSSPVRTSTPVAPTPSSEIMSSTEHPALTWTPSIVCAKTETGTSMTVKLKSGLSEFSLLVMNPPASCPADLGEFVSDIPIPETCVTDASVEVALQYTFNKDVLGGRNFRHFLFTCDDLGIDGQVKDLSTDSNPKNTSATDSSSNYADGRFRLLVASASNLFSQNQLTPHAQVQWSQGGVYLVIQHLLAAESTHRTLIPLECQVSSTSHPDKMTFYYGRVGQMCNKNYGLIDNWVIRSKRVSRGDDVTYVQMFPFDFKVGEKVTITCTIHECPFVRTASGLQGKCREAYGKYADCGGSFSPLARTARALTSAAAHDAESTEEGQTREMSASFVIAA